VKKLLLLLFSVLLGILYYAMIHVNIGTVQTARSSFSFPVSSKAKQQVKLHIAAGHHKIESIECNGVKRVLAFKKMQWFEKPEEQFLVPLHKGDNLCKVTLFNTFGKYRPVVKQKITYLDYSILFILLGVPLFTLLFLLFIRLLDLLRALSARFTRNALSKGRAEEVGSQADSWAIKLLYAVLFAAVLIRLLYFNKFGIMQFQHDWQGHIEFIKYIAQHWSLPLPSKGLEYPQQPLYYWITAGLYTLFTHFGLSDQDALYGLGFFSLFCSMVFLYYSYRFILLMSQNRWVQMVAMVFVSLTPSVVYMSARINNDVLVMALSAFTLYYAVKGYQCGFKRGFYAALAGVSLLFLTKISAAPMEVLLFALLTAAYVKAEEGTLPAVRKALYLFGVVGLFLLGFTLLRVYLPVEGTLHMVNSSGHFPGQTIRALDTEYFATFHIVPLLQAGYSHIFGIDAIRFSFPTYQYGTMFFGEFDYAWFINKIHSLHMVMQAVLALGLIFILGLLLFILRAYRHTLLENLLFVTLLLNLLLILKFMFDYPSICNTDFRYFVGSFVILAFVFAKGLEPLYAVKYIGNVLAGWIVLLAVSEVLFFALLLT
jgi:4-amino-4-deoxy-L-arabinose transferase-like glycosyltransferase